MFNHLSVENGLSTSSVLSIAKDSRGQMWFGTKNGLNKFNTINFKTYKSDTTFNSLSTGTWIFALLSDSHKRFWIGTEAGLNRYLPESDSFQQILSSKNDKNSLSDNYVNCVYEDKKGAIWVGTKNGLNKLISLNPIKFQTFFKDLPTLQKKINTLFEDSKSRLWIGTAMGLIRMEPKGTSNKLTYYYQQKELNTLSDNYITSVTEDKKGRIWVGTKNGGLNLFDEHLQQFTRINYTSDPNSLSIRKIVADKLGNLWIGTLKGLIIYNPKNGELLHFKNEPGNSSSLSNNSIKDIYFDKDGSVWIGTMYGGINILYSFAAPFKVYRYDTLPASISSNITNTIIEDKNKIWVGTDGEGLDLFNPKKGSFAHFKSNPSDSNSLNSNFVKTLYRDRNGNIWVGTLDAGMALYNPVKNNFKRFIHKVDDPTSLNSNNISAILEDEDGQLVVGTGNGGLNILNNLKGTFSTIDTTTKLRLTSNIVKTIFEDSKHQFWVGTVRGLNLFSNKFKKNVTFFKGESGLKSDYVYCVFEDSKKRLWFGTKEGGLSLYYPQTGKFSTFTTTDGLVSNNIYGIIEDNFGALWLSTDHGLSKFDSERKIFTTYNVNDGLPGNEFNSGAYKDKNGKLYFGSYNGLVSFYPSEIEENHFNPRVIFTDLKLFNKHVDIKGADSLLTKDISFTKEITFNHDQNIFTIDFAVLNYLRSNKNQYAYKLEGFEKNWNYVNISSATYTNLPAGNYTFFAKGANNDGKWSAVPAQLIIHVLPSLWCTWWAYCIYLIVFLSTLYAVIRFFKVRSRLEHELYYKVQESKQQEELYQMKLDFFTNISHEIRTPLTLINGPLEQLLKITVKDSVLQSKILGIKNNSDRLLRLIKELLEFRRTETGNMSMQFRAEDIVAFSREIFCAFENMAESQGVFYEFITVLEKQIFYFDPEQMEKALFNLISNAFKFTPSGGTITVSVRLINSNGIFCAEIKVSNTGKGISSEHIHRIFDNFYQSDTANRANGTGIGLTLAKKIVELHKGSIKVNSLASDDDKQGKTTFTITLPENRTDYSYTTTTEPLIPLRHLSEKRYSILLVEDNVEVSEFLKEALEENYSVMISQNGFEGWETAITEIPDLIISDVMMPVMDGFELLKKLKGDDRTNHIPVILLTARASQVYQMEGLEIGADAYIVKPFSVEILKLNIRNFIFLREAFRQKFGNNIFEDANLGIAVSADEKFLQKLMTIIEVQIANSEFDVAFLCLEAGMSKNILYRKVFALTGYTIADFIKYTRLKKAGVLLLEKKLSIADVAFSVGFNDRKYFSKEFRKLFGKSPSDYQRDIASSISA